MERQPSRTQLNLPLDSNSATKANEAESQRESSCKVFRMVPRAEKHDAADLSKLYANILDSVKHLE